MSVVLHVSDTHFGTEQTPVVQALTRLAQQQQPDLIVLSGDITQRALPSQFQAAFCFVQQLYAPVLAIAGNHDIPLFDLWARLRRPYARYTDVFGADLEPVYTSPDLMVVGVNTTRAWRHKNGEVSLAQVDRVARMVAEAKPDQLRIVVVHQPVAVPFPAEAPNLLRGHRLAIDRWSAAGVDLVLGGHIHLPYVMALPRLARPLWAVQAGTAVSRRVRPGVPNSVNLLRWGLASRPGCCVIEQWDFSAAEAAFVCVKLTDVWPARG
jgi:3',5'-cyclic AMP phosphodiesterase CpdA